VFGLIHGVFTFDNVPFHRGEARFIDFDDCGQGYFLYDLAILLDRLEWRQDYQSLLSGYREERPLSASNERTLDLFLTVRWTFLKDCHS